MIGKITDILKEEKPKLYLKSPFLYHKGMRYVCINKKITCTYEEIHDYRIKGTLNKIDWDILNALRQYRFLNRHCIEIFLKMEDELFMKDSLKRNLSKLVSMGIVLRFYFTWDKEGNEDTQNTPCFYALSKGAYAFFRKRNPIGTLIDNSTKSYEIPNEINILNRLVFNQFHIFFMKQYKNSIIKQLYYERVCLKGYEFFIEGCFRLKNNNGLSSNNLDIAVIPIRRNPYWKHELGIRLSLLYSYSKKYPDKVKEPIVLIICEDDLQIKEAYLHKICHAETKGIYTVYTSDIALVSEDILKHLYYCELVDKNVYVKKGDINTRNADVVLPSIFEDKEGEKRVYDINDSLAPSVNAADVVKLSIRSLEI